VPRRQIDLADVSGVGHGGTRVIGSLLVPSSWQLGETFSLQDRGDRRRADCLALAGESATDVVDRQVLLPQCDDQVPQPLLFARRSALPRGRDEEIAPGLVAELMDKDPEAPRRIAEPSGRFRRREAVNEEGPEASYCR